MTDPADAPDFPPPPEPTPRKRGHPILAWLVIVALVVVTTQHLWKSRLAEAGGPLADRMNEVTLQLQGRYVVGVASFFGAGERAQLAGQLKALDTGSLGQRLRFAVLTGELSGPDEAEKVLDELDRERAEGKFPNDPDDQPLIGVLRRLYRDYEEKHLDAPSVGDQREVLVRRLGWFGELALAPRDGPDREARAAVLAPARRTAALILGGLTTAAVVGLFGFTGLVLFVVLLLAGRLREGITGEAQYGGVYAEAFALWMLLYEGISYLGSRIDVPGPPLLVAGGVSLLCLVLALLWPLLRGVPWSRLRRDVGLTFGRNPALEPVLGLSGYCMALPLLAVGAGSTIVLMRLQQLWYQAHPDLGPPPEPPSHPIIGLLGNLDLWVLLQLLLLASVVAPVVEETMFRGLLYRHLRELTGRWGRATSTLFGAAVVSFVFAAIHPQGLVAVPPLMALAFTFNLLREWRGTLIPSMVAHGVNNGLLMLFFYFALGK